MAGKNEDMRPALPKRGVVPDDWFERDERTPMSKAVTRSVVLSLLSPLAGAKILEIGSGTGAMTVELLRAAGSGGSVTSVEKSSASLDLAARNIKDSGFAANARLIAGRAPDDIPDEIYDAAFIGGHGRALEDIMRTCWERVSSGGRLLVAALTPGTTSRTLACLDSLGADSGFWRIHASVGRKAGSEWLLHGNNPIDLMWGDK